MTRPLPSEQKSADRLAFEHYLRTGQRLSANEWLELQEHKFNPYHDEHGRFTSAPGSAQMGQVFDTAPPTAPRRTAPANAKRPAAAARPAPYPRTRVAALSGFPETGKASWRSSNDQTFIAAAADSYNQKYGLKPGDQGFRTPEFFKAWAMRESGGEGDEQAFRTDPFQVNKAGDWVNEKTLIAGLRKGERMTPTTSAAAALEWLRHKSRLHDTSGNVVRVLDDQAALERYNTVQAITRQSGNLPHKVWYAQTILQMAGQATAVRK